MGKLALAGAIQGLGKGAEMEVANKRAVDKEQRAAERETAIRKMEQEFHSSENVKTRDFQAGQQGKEFKHTEQMETSREGAATGRQKSQLDTQVSEGAKDRESREKIAGINASSRSNSKSFKSRWQAKPTTTTVYENNIPVQKSVINMVDMDQGLTYVQHGYKFFPQGIEPANAPKVKDAKKEQADVQSVIQNPDLVDKFIAAYGYLPAGVIARMQSNKLSSEKSSSADEEE